MVKTLCSASTAGGMNLIFGQGTCCKVWLNFFFKKRTYGKAYWIVTGTIYEMYDAANGLAKKPIKKKSYPYFRPSEKACPHYSPALIGRRKPFESLVPCGEVTSASCPLATESPTFLTQEFIINILHLQGTEVEFRGKSRNFKQVSYQFSIQHKKQLSN